MAIEIYDYKDFTIALDYDTEPQSPRDWAPFGVMVLDHKRYSLPHECSIDVAQYDSLDDVVKALKMNYDAFIVLPIWGYDHSGLSMKAGNRSYPFDDIWDAGVLGVIFCTKKAFQDEYLLNNAVTHRQAVARLIGEVEAYNAYSSGEVYGYHVTAPDGEEETCWGYYDYAECKREAQASVDDVVAAMEMRQAEELARINTCYGL